MRILLLCFMLLGFNSLAMAHAKNFTCGLFELSKWKVQGGNNGDLGRLTPDQTFTWSDLATPKLLLKEGKRTFYIAQQKIAPFVKLQIVDPEDTIEVWGQDDVVFDSSRMDRHFYCFGFDE